jgi:hypothetical protein
MLASGAADGDDAAVAVDVALLTSGRPLAEVISESERRLLAAPVRLVGGLAGPAYSLVLGASKSSSAPQYQVKTSRSSEAELVALVSHDGGAPCREAGAHPLMGWSGRAPAESATS